MAVRYPRCAGYVLLKELAREPLGPTFRAGRVVGDAIDQLVLLRKLELPRLDAAATTAAIAQRQGLPERLRTPFLADLVDSGTCDGTPFLAYDYTPGLSAAAVLTLSEQRMTPPAPDLAAVIVERSAQALVALHAAGLDHGMVVPELVWISTEGEVRLHGAEAGPTLRRPASGLGDLAPYLAPEVRAGETPSAADEVWSLAALLAALLTGAPPSPGADIDSWLAGATLADDGNPLPEPIADLLGRSLVPRPQRLARLEAWHQSLLRALEMVGWRATPFQLAVFMHSLCKAEMARESKDIEREREEALKPPPPEPAPAPAVAAVADATPAAPAVAPRAPFAADEEWEESKGSGMGTKLGIAAAVVALLAVGGWFLTRKPAAPVAATPTATPAPTVAAVPVPSPAGPTRAELEQKFAEMAAERGKSLTEHYSAEMDALRKQIEESRRQEAAASAAAAAAPAPVAPAPAPEPKPTETPAPAPAPAAPAPAPTVAAAPAAPAQPEAPLVPPKLLRFDPPPYPTLARKRKVEGTVVLTLRIDPSGKVTDVRFVRRIAEDVGINEAAAEAAQRARFSPATRGGVPVEAFYTLTVPFQL